ncbi:unnamed protein product [Moneuplotes crassus]|uniref:EF-hand domain-containing protein n=1 Tax=Euplotes crassus TaxID=5936 RepID=A0AAD1XAL0_EUPCR|nr:unnamed protein product [Moneuplotes crassus]
MLKIPKKALFNNNTRMTIDTRTNEVKRIKPKRSKLDKEKLYDQVIDYKNQMNEFREENIKLKTQLKQLEKEQLNNEALAEEIKQGQQLVGRMGKSMTRQRESFLALALKKQVAEQRNIIRQKNSEIDELKKAYKHTRINELETDQKVYIEELMRMRNILEQVLKTKDPLMNPETAERIENDLKINENKLKNVRKENQELAEIIKTKDQEILEQNEKLKDKETRIEKLRVSVKEKNKLKHQQREKNKELSKVRNELILLRAQTGAKGKQEMDVVLKSQNDMQKDQINNKNIAINSLKQEKKKLASKVTSLSKKLDELQASLDDANKKLKKEAKQKKYYEGLYKEEREKNLDLQSQTPKKAVQEKDSVKNARPISASIHGRGIASSQKLEEVKENIFEDAIDNNMGDKSQDTENKSKKNLNSPIELKHVRPIAFSLRLHISDMGIDSLKSVFSDISFTLNSFKDRVQKLFKLENEDGLKLARYIFEKDTVRHNGKIEFEPEKSLLVATIIKELEILCTKDIKFNAPLYKRKDTEILEKSIYEKIKKSKSSISELVEEVMSSFAIDDEDQTGYLRVDSVQDIIDMQDLDLDDEELQYFCSKMFKPDKQGVHNLYYKEFDMWLKHISSKFEPKKNPPRAVDKIQPQKQEPHNLGNNISDSSKKFDEKDKTGDSFKKIDESNVKDDTNQFEESSRKDFALSEDKPESPKMSPSKPAEESFYENKEESKISNLEESNPELNSEDKNPEETPNPVNLQNENISGGPIDISSSQNMKPAKKRGESTEKKSSSSKAAPKSSSHDSNNQKESDDEDLFPENESEKNIFSEDYPSYKKDTPKTMKKDVKEEEPTPYQNIAKKDSSSKALDSSKEEDASKKSKKKVDIDQFKPLGLKILADIVTYVSQNPNTDLFGEHVFVQPVKSKNKQTDIYVIEAENFFESLELFGIVTMPINPVHKKELKEAKDNMQELLCIDPSFKDLLLIKKINYAVSQLSNDPKMLEKAKSYGYTSIHDPTPIKNQADSDSEKDNNSYEDEFIDDEVEESKSNLQKSSLDKSPQKIDESIPDDNDYGTTFEEAKISASLQKSSPSIKKRADTTDDQIYSNDFDSKNAALKTPDTSKENIKEFSDLQKQESSDKKEKSSKQDFYKQNKIVDDDSDEIIDDYQF